MTISLERFVTDIFYCGGQLQITIYDFSTSTLLYRERLQVFSECSNQ